MLHCVATTISILKTKCIYGGDKKGKPNKSVKPDPFSLFSDLYLLTMTESLIYKESLDSKIQKNQFSDLDSKCSEFLKCDEIRFVGLINNMGNLVSQASKEKDWVESEEKRRMFFMQTVLQISLSKDFDNSLGKTEYFATNRKNFLMVAISLKNYVVVIFAKPTLSIEEVISKAQVWGFSDSEI